MENKKLENKQASSPKGIKLGTKVEKPKENKKKVPKGMVELTARIDFCGSKAGEKVLIPESKVEYVKRQGYVEK